jgi:hypothetical protein
LKSYQRQLRICEPINNPDVKLTYEVIPTEENFDDIKEFIQSCKCKDTRYNGQKEKDKH